MKDQKTLLEVREVTHCFGHLKVLDQVSFDLREGEIHCLVGTNGSGKSTLIKIISGVLPSDQEIGIFFDGTTIRSVNPRKAKELGIKVIYQDLSLFDNLTVSQNIAFELTAIRQLSLVNAQRQREIAASSLKKLGIKLNLSTMVRDLSIANQQLVAIARALSGKAKVIFMDEPTASLSKNEVFHLLKVVKSLCEQGISIVFVSHRLDEVLSISHRITVIRDGVKVGTYPANLIDKKKLSVLMSGKDIRWPAKIPSNSSTPVIELRDLSHEKHFHHIDLTLHRGEILGLAGLMGSGRTELFLSLFGLIQPSQGEIILNGTARRFTSNQEAMDHGIAYLSEDRLRFGMIKEQSIEDNITVSIFSRLSQKILSLPLFNLSLLNYRNKERQAKNWVDDLKIKVGKIQDTVDLLSGGNQQKVVLAKCLAIKPKVLLLDCPTVGVDIAAKLNLFTIVQQLAQKGMAIFIISDELEELYANCDRILHMQQKTIIGEYLPQKMTFKEMEKTIYEK